MSMKGMKIMLVIAAVLCAVGISLALIRGGGAMPRNFDPPGWLEALRGLAGGPILDRDDPVGVAEPLATKRSVSGWPDPRLRSGS